MKKSVLNDLYRRFLEEKNEEKRRAGYLTDSEWDSVSSKLARRKRYPGAGFFPDGPATSPSASENIELAQDDCVEFMKNKPDNCVDFALMDPPYGINYVGMEWDADVPGVDVWQQTMRVLKPGAFAVIAAAPRTYNETAEAMRAAGFEIRDMLIWRYTQSFPAAAGVEGQWRSGLRTNQDPWVVARKPLEKGLSLRKNWEKWGTGAVRTGAVGDAWETNVIDCPKAKKREKTLGLVGHLQAQKIAGSDRSGTFAASISENTHPTVKPVKLLRHICKTFCKEGGLIYDGFMGSGSTGVAAVAEGYSFWGTEIDPHHFQTASLRIFHAQQHAAQIPGAA